MRWTVVWSEEAGREVQRVLRSSRFAQQLANELVRLDARLANDPEQLGESREGQRRILIELPFILAFQVLPDRHTVLVTEFRYHPGR